MYLYSFLEREKNTKGYMYTYFLEWEKNTKGYMYMYCWLIAQSTAQGHLRAFHKFNFAHKLNTIQNMHTTQTQNIQT